MSTSRHTNTEHPPCTNCGATDDYHACGLCHTCYARNNRRKHGAQPRTKKGERTCDKCPAVHYAKGLCVRCYRQEHPYVRAKATPGPRKTRSDKGQPRVTRKPKSNLPAGWERTGIAAQTRAIAGGVRELGVVKPTAPELLAGGYSLLARHDALDLADMLGLVAA